MLVACHWPLVPALSLRFRDGARGLGIILKTSMRLDTIQGAMLQTLQGSCLVRIGALTSNVCPGLMVHKSHHLDMAHWQTIVTIGILACPDCLLTGYDYGARCVTAY